MRPALKFLSGIGKKLIADLLPAALASTLAGLVFSHLLSPPPPNANSPDLASAVHDAHEIVLDYSRKEEDLRRQMAMSTLVVRPAVETAPTDFPPRDRNAASPRNGKPAVAASPTRDLPVQKAERKLASASTSKPPAAPEPAMENRQPGEPLALSNFTTVPPPPVEPENFFAATLKGAFTVVKKVPHWAGSAAEFVLELPARAISPRKPSPEAEFLKVAL